MDYNILKNDGSLYKVTEWVSRLVYVNILWIVFTIMGLGIFGIMPATISMLGIIKKWFDGKENVEVFKEYWQIYKANFIKINIIGLIMFVIGLVLIIDLRYFNSLSGVHYLIIRYFIYLIIFLYFIDLIYIFPITIQYQLRKRDIIKNALFFGFLSPLETLQMILGLIGVTFLFRVLPSLLPFLGVSIPVLVIIWASEKAIKKVENKVRQNKK